MSLNDSDFIQRIKKGDKDAFEKLFRCYYPTLCNHALHYVKSKEDAEEIVQELFFTIWKKRGKLADNTQLNAYLFKACHLNCLAFLRSNKVRDIYSKSYKQLHQEGIDTSELEMHELNGLIAATLSKLPERTLQIFKLSRYEGLKYKDIADKLSISIKTVEANMSKALRLLRTHLKDYLGSI